MFELIFFIMLLFINFILVFRPIPIIAFPIGLFSIYIGAIEFLQDTTNLPYQPHLTIFFILMCTCTLLINALDIRGK